MSTAELKELRKEVKRDIGHADEKIIRKIYVMLETGAESDLWNEMPDEIVAELEESIAQSKRGQTITHEQVKKKHPQWFTKRV